MPHYTYSRGARRKKLFTRISSTFINDRSGLASSIAKPDSMLHSKSTYFYRWGSSHKLSSSLSYVVSSVCALALLVGGMITINPTFSSNNHVHATSIGEATNPGDGDTTPSISIAFPTTGLPEGYNNSAEQTTTVTPGVVAYRSNYFDVTVKNPSWYAVSVGAAKGYTSELKNGNTLIPGVGKNVTPNNFKENTWGYALTRVSSTSTTEDDSTLLYNTMPADSETPLSQSNITSEANVTEHYKVSFATLLSGDVPNGHYTTSVYLSAVIDPGHLTNSFGVATMQAMGKDPSTCSNASVGTTIQLYDERDNKRYWVTKLADGNCWMTQNLDFDIPATLSSSTSDVNSPNTSTNIAGSTSIADWSNTGNTANYYTDPGDFIYTYPNHGQSSSTCTGIQSLEDAKCTDRFSKATADSNMHYHIGNYYSYDAATVRSKTDVSASSSSYNDAYNATMSICPAGWKLPTSNNTNAGSFGALMSSYQLADYTLSTEKGSLYNDPMYFVYGGSIYSGKILSAGYNGSYWSSTTAMSYSDSNGIHRPAYALSFYGNINPSSSDGRAAGRTIRCLLKV